MVSRREETEAQSKAWLSRGRPRRGRRADLERSFFFRTLEPESLALVWLRRLLEESCKKGAGKPLEPEILAEAEKGLIRGDGNNA